VAPEPRTAWGWARLPLHGGVERGSGEVRSLGVALTLTLSRQGEVTGPLPSEEL
jgi:hypothetical protein